MIRVEKAELHHVPEIHAIEAESFAVAWSETSIKYEVIGKHSICLVLVDDADFVYGHAYMRHVINEGHICNIAVRLGHRNQGFASMLVEAFLQEAAKLEMIGLTLEVRESNIAAINLYKKHGFKQEGIRKDYYSHPIEDGIIMWRYL
jgi:ribosomal-protein-alanine N-acetyltransferase